MPKVSVIIPGRCEQYFQATVDSTLANAKGDIEVIPVIDGYEPDPPLVFKDDRVKPIFLEESIGQRAAYNLGVEYSSGDYIMKLDAHAIPAPGFDVELAATCPEKGVIIPTMSRLDVRKWKRKRTGNTHYMYTGSDCYTHFWREYGKRPEAQGDVVEVMANQGSCWFWSRKWHDYVEGLDGACGSWGMVGIEVGLKSWLCGGTHLVNKRTWQAHWFRRKDGGFTYPMSGRDVAKAHNYCRNNWFRNDHAFRHQCRPFRWLLDKFAPVPSWEFEYLPGTKYGDLIDDFHKIFYSHWNAVSHTSWMGWKVVKYPTDLIIYQQLIWKHKPEVIVECGTERGGSANFFASLFDLMQSDGKVISIDIKNQKRIDKDKLPKNPRITYLAGSSTDPEIFAQVKELVGNKKCMVILDSDHKKAHVMREMALYGPIVSKKQYMVVEDTALHGHPVRMKDPPGPWEAVAAYMANNDDFERSPIGEKYFISQSAGGWLKKKK